MTGGKPSPSDCVKRKSKMDIQKSPKTTVEEKEKSSTSHNTATSNAAPPSNNALQQDNDPPRQPNHPHDCTICKVLETVCNQQQPCSHCVMTEREAFCKYTPRTPCIVLETPTPGSSPIYVGDGVWEGVVSALRLGDGWVEGYEE